MVPDIKLHPKQYEAYSVLNNSQIRFLNFGGGRSGGKSWLGWVWLITNCYAYPGTKWFCGREELKRLRMTTLRTFFKVCKALPIPENDYVYNGQDHFIAFKTGSIIDLLELKFYPSDPLYQRFGSSEYTGGWIEEGGEVSMEAFDMLKSSVGRQDNDKYGLIPAKILITCNPAKNWLYTTFYLPKKNGTLPSDYSFIQSLYNDNIYREPDTQKQLESIINESQKQRLMYGNWEYADDPDALITYEDLINLKYVDRKPGINFCGSDVARMGDDKSTFAKFEGNYLAKLKTFSELDTAILANRLIDFQNIESIPAENTGIDTVGLGAGTYDSMKEKRRKCIEIISGAKPTKIYKNGGTTYEFKNLRSQMWWQFRLDCKGMNICIDSDDQELLTDLTAPRYKIINEKMIQVEPKEEIKKRLGRSPDKGDAVVYANAMRAGIIKSKAQLKYTTA